MIAVDTNVLVRLVVDDDPEQARRARNLFRRGGVPVATTVLPESALTCPLIPNPSPQGRREQMVNPATSTSPP